MNYDDAVNPEAVILADPFHAQEDRTFRAHRSALTLRDITAGEAVRAQTRTRVGTAIAIGMLHVLMLGVGAPRGTGNGQTVWLVSLVALYVLFVCCLHARLRWRRPASPTQVSVALLLDILFIDLWTAASTSPAHYERALLGMVVVVHVANFYFGRRQAWRAIMAGASGFILLLASAVSNGQRVDVAEGLLSLALCVAGCALMVLQASDVRRRLRTIVGLFEHVEEGEFGRTYDVDADRLPDAITRVGHAYNRVRLQLANMVLSDPLTGCLNRRGFDQALAREVARSSRARSGFALLAVDLDHFKSINDTYGHMAGDAVLRTVGMLLLGAARAGDIVARVGGEEFAILVPDATDAGALLFATRLCELIRGHPFAITADGMPISITTSVGAVAGTPRGMENLAALLWSRADAALYAAKRSGRDCARVWRPGLSTTGEYHMVDAGDVTNFSGHGSVATPLERIGHARTSSTS